MGSRHNNEFEMLPDERQAYNKEKDRRAGKNKTGTKPLTDIVDMSPEVKAIYERALGKIDEKLTSARPLNELPGTEDIYRQPTPDDMKNLPSDESIYRPSQPLIDQTKSAIEPEPGLKMNRLISSVLWVLILVAVAFLIMQFIR